jgi:hypothetical protein
LEPKGRAVAARLRHGGWGGIRTHGELAPTLVFKTSAFNRSATHPLRQAPNSAARAAQSPAWLALVVDEAEESINPYVTSILLL